MIWILIMTHYEDAVELTSPVAAQLLGTPDGQVIGKENLKAYFKRGLGAYPELRFQLEDVLWGLNSVVLYYINQEGNARGGVHGVGGGVEKSHEWWRTTVANKGSD